MASDFELIFQACVVNDGLRCVIKMGNDVEGSYTISGDKTAWPVASQEK